VSLTQIPELRIELGPAAKAVERAGRRVVDLLGRQDDPDRGVTGLEWSIAEAAAHLAARTGRFARYLAGSETPEGPISVIATENEQDVRERSSRTPGENVEELRSELAAFVTASRGRLGSDPFPWYSGATIDVATATGLLLGELDVHGFDVARTGGTRWPIPAEDGRTILRAAVVLAPLYVDPETTRGVSVTFRIVVRGGPAFRIRFDDGTATVEAAAGEADVTIRADPVSLVLLSYGRVSKWRALATGKLYATGRRPWAALDFDRFFLPP
jgi:Mycothiol maleylpyruvate isomerase N-terminal domain/SCP-2 sterol transfer family